MQFFLSYRVGIPIIVFLVCLIGFMPDITPEKLLVSVCFASLGAFIYLINKVYDWEEDAINISGYHLNVKRFKATKYISYLCLFLPLFYLMLVSNMLGLYIAVGIAGFLYSYPVAINGRKRRFKNFLWVKNLVPAFCWACVTVLTPHFYYQEIIGGYEIALWLMIFIFVFAIEVMWDVRDMEGDKASAVQTLPNAYGLGLTKIICALPMLAIFIWRFLHVDIHPIFITAYVLTIISILCVRKNSHPLYFQNIIMIWILASAIFIFYKKVMV